MPTAWLSLDEQDDPGTLDTYLAFAFQRAGLDVLEPLRLDDRRVGHAQGRITLLLRALEVHGGPCVLALDELERVTNPEVVALLNSLVRMCPPGLHLAMSCRELPVGLDIVAPVFAEAARILTAEDLRFSRVEIAQFFDRKLSRRELAVVAEASAGWPIALRIQRNARTQPARERAQLMQSVIENWVESRLWFDMTEDDREFLLDVGLLEWMDAELLDEVLGGADLMRRLEAMGGLVGLLEPVRGGAMKVWRLHPLIREHCVACRRRETPERYRAIHRRVAAVLAWRGETVAAMGHAAEAADPSLIGQILMDAGGLRFWLREGSDRLVAADRFLTDETLEMYPRLYLVRVVALAVKGRLAEARRCLQAQVLERQTNRAGTGPDGDGQPDADRCLAQALVAQNGCVSPGSEEGRALIAEVRRIMGSPGVEPLIGGTMEYGLCQVHNLQADFEQALEHGGRARRWIGTRSQYLTMALDFQFGQIAMAQGHVRDAMHWYRSGLQAAKRRFPHDRRLTVLGEVLSRELSLERNQVAEDGAAAAFSKGLWRRGAQFASYAAASGVAAELVLEARGIEAALSLLDEMREHAERTELAALVRYLVALRVAVLAGAARVSEADGSWRAGALPESFAGCLDLRAQTWREMEALSCARLRLLIARGAFDEGRRFARDLVDVATGRGLRRTWMRALALAMALEESAGERGAAVGHLSTFLELFADTDYMRPMVREGDAATLVLRAFLDANRDSPCRSSAQVLLAAAGSEAVVVPSLSGREREVLGRLETQSDQQIGEALGISKNGVRYHVGKLFVKLKARDRFEACRRGRNMGLLGTRGHANPA